MAVVAVLARTQRALAAIRRLWQVGPVAAVVLALRQALLVPVHRRAATHYRQPGLLQQGALEARLTHRTPLAARLLPPVLVAMAVI